MVYGVCGSRVEGTENGARVFVASPLEFPSRNGRRNGCWLLAGSGRVVGVFLTIFATFSCVVGGGRVYWLVARDRLYEDLMK